MNYLIFTDGGSRGNPGKSACAFVVYDGKKKVIFEQGLYLGVKTNNEAEYLGVLSGLKWLKNSSEELKHLTLKLDSKLVVEQLSGRWKIKDSRMQILCDQCQKLLKELNLEPEIIHVPRAENARADALVNQVLDTKAD
ncbi:MAG: ribonuclease HI family protein [bacterium]|nr:ribonuclease HI family protein [bacterium]